jgi:hypothetical protein
MTFAGGSPGDHGQPSAIQSRPSVGRAARAMVIQYGEANPRDCMAISPLWRNLEDISKIVMLLRGLPPPYSGGGPKDSEKLKVNY